MIEPSNLRATVQGFLTALNPEAKDYQDYTIDEVLPDEAKPDRFYITLSYNRPRKFTNFNKLTESITSLQIMDRESKVFIICTDGTVIGMKKPG